MTWDVPGIHQVRAYNASAFGPKGHQLPGHVGDVMVMVAGWGGVGSGDVGGQGD